MPIVNRFLADTGRFVSGTGQNGLYLWIILCYLVIYLVKSHTIREIAGRHDCFRHKAVLVADSVGFLGKLPFVFSLSEQAALRACRALLHSTKALLLPAGQLLLAVLPLRFLEDAGGARLTPCSDGIFGIRLQRYHNGESAARVKTLAAPGVDRSNGRERTSLRCGIRNENDRIRERDYSSTAITTPEPTVRPPSRMAKRRLFSIAIGVISSTFMSMLSPGMHISTPSGRVMMPVTSVVRK